MSIFPIPLFALFLFLLVGCGSFRNVVTTPQSYTIPLNLGVLPPSDIYINMDYGVRLNIQDKKAANHGFEQV